MVVEGVEGVGDAAAGGVLVGHQAVVAMAMFDGAEDRFDVLELGELDRPPEVSDGGEVAERSGGAEVADPQRLLEGEAAGHQLAID